MNAIEHNKKHLALIEDYQAVFESEAGGRVLLDLMENGHLLKPIFSEKLNPIEAQLTEGKRELVIYIMSQLKKDIKQLAKIIDINIKGAKNEDEGNYFPERD